MIASRDTASQLLAVAREKTGARKPEEQPEVFRNFDRYPDILSEIDDQLHDLNAQAQICEGTDTHVGGVGVASLMTTLRCIPLL